MSVELFTEYIDIEILLFSTPSSLRARVLGYFDELEDTPDGGEHAIIDMEGCDIFGQPKEVSPSFGFY